MFKYFKNRMREIAKAVFKEELEGQILVNGDVLKEIRDNHIANQNKIEELSKKIKTIENKLSIVKENLAEKNQEVIRDLQVSFTKFKDKAIVEIDNLFDLYKGLVSDLNEAKAKLELYNNLGSPVEEKVEEEKPEPVEEVVVEKKKRTRKVKAKEEVKEEVIEEPVVKPKRTRKSTK